MVHNEAAFSAAIVKVMKENHWFVQRIESGTTGRGIPDMYVVNNHNMGMWIELKRIHMRMAGRRDGVVNVTWRPGQQNWLNRVHRFGQCAMTLIAFDDCVGIVHAGKRYEKNIVPISDIVLVKDIRTLIGTLDA